MDLVILAASCALHGTILIAAPEPPCRDPNPPRVRSQRTTDTGLPQWEPVIDEAARRFALPPAWIARVMQAESGGHTTLAGYPITSPKGAIGLMQLMPGTYDDMRRAYDLGHDPYDPHDNILAGAAYLRAMFDRFGGGVFAAYNAGPGRYQAYLNGTKGLPQETISYLAKLDQPAPESGQQSAKSVIIPSGSELFFALSSPTTGAVRGVRSRGARQAGVVRSVVSFAINGPRASRPVFTKQQNLFVVLSFGNRQASH